IIEKADFVVIESTYGDRRHRSLTETREEFAEVIQKALEGGGKVLIPSFVVDRAQRVLYELSLLKKSLSFDYPVFFDSPMGAKVTGIYLKYRHLFAGEMQKLNLDGENPFAFSDLRYVTTPEESKSLNEKEKAMVIAGSGMCAGGRIVHHLKHNLYKDSTRIIFVGFQAQGTLGRILVDGAKKVRIMGEEIAVRAQISTINGFSAHADQEDLLRWAEYFKSRPTFFVVHGEDSIAEKFAHLLSERGFKTFVPSLEDTVDLHQKTLTASGIAFREEEDLMGILEQKVRELRGGRLVMDERSKTLLRTALVLLEEVEERALSQ
ncbi:MAG: MBL fold metallo-hydrolase RNA specificity domain-containing protein, partial [Candidatus Caldatribacteriaceae bacterium]